METYVENQHELTVGFLLVQFTEVDFNVLIQMMSDLKKVSLREKGEAWRCVRKFAFQELSNRKSENWVRR